MAIAACAARALRKSSHSSSRMRSALKDFQHPLDLSFRYQRDSVVTDEVLARQEYSAQKVVMLLFQIGDMHDAAFLRGPPGITLAQGWRACSMALV